MIHPTSGQVIAVGQSRFIDLDQFPASKPRPSNRRLKWLLFYLLALGVSFAQGRLAQAHSVLAGVAPDVQADQPQGFVVKPKLYMLAIGISQYQQSELSLRFAARDAQGIAEVFARQKGLLYDDVQARILLDDAATKADILDGLEWLQRQTTALDVAVLFLAGHGINDPSTGRYFFLPHDADPEAIRRSMISQDDIQSTLQSLAGKSLLFLDTCHAGNVLNRWSGRGDADLSLFIRELVTADNSAVVFAAATGKQVSKESADWENGAFTKAVIEGLSGRAAFIADRPITVGMLELYVSERVKKLTDGTQTPTAAKPQTMADYPVAMPVNQTGTPSSNNTTTSQPLAPPILTGAGRLGRPSAAKVRLNAARKHFIFAGVLAGVALVSILSGAVMYGISKVASDEFHGEDDEFTKRDIQHYSNTVNTASVSAYAIGSTLTVGSAVLLGVGVYKAMTAPDRSAAVPTFAGSHTEIPLFGLKGWVK